MPRATTAAWEVLPPRAVRMPCAAIMPGRMTGPVAAAKSKTTASTAAPGERRQVEAGDNQLGELLTGDP
jgi:hypothetical protein